MIDPKRMKRLWDACPELRPEGLEFADCADGPGVWSLDLDGMELIDDDDDDYDDESWNSEPKSIGAEPCSMIPPQSAAALIRDKCVWWLARQERDCVLQVSKSGKYGIGQRMGKQMVMSRVSEIGMDDPTEACLLAVERVLGLEPWEQANG